MRPAVPRLPAGRGARAALAAALALVVIVAAVVVLWFTPALAVRTIRIDGLDHVPQAEVAGVLGIDEGTPLLRVDTDAAAHRVAGIARVAEVSVHREFPSTITVDVTERVPVAYVDDGAGPQLLDADAVRFADEPPPPGVPRLTVADPHDAALTRSVLEAVAGMPPALRDQITAIDIASPSDISFTIGEDRTLRWGDVGRSRLKAEVALAVLQQPGKTVDVSSPNLPTTE